MRQFRPPRHCRIYSAVPSDSAGGAAACCCRRWSDAWSRVARAQQQQRQLQLTQHSPRSTRASRCRRRSSARRPVTGTRLLIELSLLSLPPPSTLAVMPSASLMRWSGSTTASMPRSIDSSAARGAACSLVRASSSTFFIITCSYRMRNVRGLRRSSVI